MKRIAILGLAGATVLTTFATASAQGPRAGSPKSHTRVIELKELVDGRTFGAVDNPPLEATSIGDSIAFSRVVAKRTGTPVGRIDVTCIVTAAPTSADAHQVCHGVLTLPRGQITLETAIVGAPTIAHVAVTGGSGAYAGASGVMTSVVQESGEELITLSLLR